MKKLTCSIIVVMVLSIIISSYINIVKAVSTPHITYTSHVQEIGWQDYVQEGEQSGTSGQSLRLEGIKIKTITVSIAVRTDPPSTSNNSKKTGKERKIK